MTEPIFRYILVLVAVIIVLRILLNIPAGKKQEDNNQPAEEISESENMVEVKNPLENQHEEVDNSLTPAEQEQERNDD